MLLLTCNDAASLTTVPFTGVTSSLICSEVMFIMLFAAFTLSFNSSEPVPNTRLELVMVPIAPSLPVSVPVVVVPPLMIKGAALEEKILPAMTPVLVRLTTSLLLL